MIVYRSHVWLLLLTLGLRLAFPAQQRELPTTPDPSETPALFAAGSSDSYVIGRSDVVTVTVWKQPTLSGNLLVRPDGKISMPLVGDVEAAGLTPLKLASKIAGDLTKYYQDPNVTVVLAEIHSRIVYLLGQVQRPGPVELTPDMTLLQAISSGGGLKDFASKRKIYILRSAAGARQKIPVNYKKALNGDRAFDVPMEPGDTIVVP